MKMKRKKIADWQKTKRNKLKKSATPRKRSAPHSGGLPALLHKLALHERQRGGLCPPHIPVPIGGGRMSGIACSIVRTHLPFAAFELLCDHFRAISNNTDLVWS